MIVLIYAAIGLLTIYIIFRKTHKKGQPIPSPAGWPFVGYAFKLKTETAHTTYAELAEQYGDIFMVKTFGEPIVVLNNAEFIRSMFCDDPYKKNANDRLELFYGQKTLYGSKSIMTAVEAYNSPHGEIRKAFTRDMHVYGEGIADFEANVHAELVKFNERIERFEEEEFNMQEQIKMSLSNILATFVDGRGFSDDDPGKNMFWEFDVAGTIFVMPDVDALLKTFPFLCSIPGYYKTKFDIMMKARDTIVQRFFYDAKRSFKPGTTRGLVDFYLAEQRLPEAEGRQDIFTDERICSQIVETFATGLAISQASIASTFLCLLNHPEYQTKIQKELDSVIGEDRLPSVSDRHKCVTTEAVALEVQRYITTAPLWIPHFCKSDMEFKGYAVPANSVLVANAWYIHHDEKIWGDPWTFRPERWIDENGEILPNDHTLRKSWLAFGTGRRQCVAESFARSRIFLFIATLLKQWTFEMLPEHAVSCDPRQGHFDVVSTCQPKSYLCRAVRRK